MTDFRELKELDYEDSAIYRRTNGDVVQITRVDEKPPVRQWDGLSNTVYDFVHGYIEDQEVYNMKTLYQSLDNQELISIVSASGRDMTEDTRLYLSARDYYDHLVALKAPQEALDAQQEIASVYLDHLKAYGDACVVMCKKNLAFADIDKYGSAEACLRASIDRMDAVAKGKVYELRYYKAKDIRKQLDQQCESLQPSFKPMIYAGVEDVIRELGKEAAEELTFSSIQKQPEQETENEQGQEPEQHQGEDHEKHENQQRTDCFER